MLIPPKNHLKILLLQRDMSYADLAVELTTSIQTIRNIATGDNKSCSARRRIEEYFGQKIWAEDAESESIMKGANS